MATSTKLRLPQFAAFAAIFGVLALTRAAPLDGQVKPEAGARQVARVVYGLLSYTQLDEMEGQRTLCQFGNTAYAEALAQSPYRTAGRTGFVFKEIEAASTNASIEAITSSCDALYIGSTTLQQRDAMLAALVAKPIVTILESSEFCDEGALFCLQLAPSGRVGFRVNLDTVAMSGVRVNPQVLKLGTERAP